MAKTSQFQMQACTDGRTNTEQKQFTAKKGLIKKEKKITTMIVHTYWAVHLKALYYRTYNIFFIL